MNDLVFLVLGEELYSSLDPVIQAMVCMFIFSLICWLSVKLFSSIGRLF